MFLASADGAIRQYDVTNVQPAAVAIASSPCGHPWRISSIILARVASSRERTKSRREEGAMSDKAVQAMQRMVSG